MDHREDEKVMAGLLKRGLRESAAPPAAACPDAGILAAYFEQVLDPAEGSNWEAHFSKCERCQQQLAALARMEPAAAASDLQYAAANAQEQLQPVVAARPMMAATGPVQAQTGAGKRASVWRARWPWLAAAAAGLSAAALWIAIQPPARRQAVSAPQPASPPDQLAMAPRAETKSGINVPRIQSVAPAPHAPALHAAPSSVARIPRKAQRNETLARTAGGAPPGGATASTELSAGLSKPQPLHAAPETAAGNAKAPTTQSLYAAKSLPAPVPPPGMRAAPKAKVNGPQISSAQALMSPAAGRFSQTVVVEGRSNEVTIPSPDPNVMWRVSASGTIEHTRDGGKTWKGQFLEQGGGEMALVAGSAPSDKICWAVGNAGTILRTTDGEKWAKIAFATSDDLIKVEAIDAQTATVSTASGKIYMTHDGGRTWQLKRD